MDILVMYHSRTGRTRAMAEEVACGVEEVEGVVCRLKPAGDVTVDDFVSAAGIIAGSPVYFGTMAAELKAVFDKLITVRKKMAGKVGSEFKRHFEEACQRRKICLFVLPPHPPKLNGRVERSNRTHREEFYEVEDIDLSLEGHNRQLEKWHDIYNYIRPHQVLAYLTPHEYYQSWLKSHRPLPSLR